jgi:spermidine/putrescine transport system substrate-binding protein
VKRSRVPLVTAVTVLVFFYLPILVLVVNSFNAARFGGQWEGFSLQWYERLFHQREIWTALENSLIIAVAATAASVVLGTTAAIALHRFSSRLQRFHFTLIYTPLVVPEILMGISLLLFFAAIGLELGLFTIFLAHVTFCISYVTMDHSLAGAAAVAGAGHRRRRPAGLHPVHRRFRDHFFRGRAGLHHPAHPDLQHDQARLAAADQRLVHPAAGGDVRGGLAEPATHGGKTMKNLLVPAVLAAALVLPLALLPAGCSRTVPQLNVYTWADYFKPELIQRFEKENGCRVVIDTFDSNEAMYAKLRAGGGGYDLITPSSYMVHIMQRQGLLQPLRPDLLPNTAHIDPEYLKIALDPKMEHSVPYMLSVTGLAYLKSKVPDFQPTWAMLDRKDLAGRMTMLDDMRETLGAALKFLGYSINSRNETELAAARDVVIRWKKNLAKFESEQYKTGLASGEFLLVHGYSGDILQVQAENGDIAFAVPREGTSIACDDLVIPKDAADWELAHAFINFLCDPKVAAENTEFISYLAPNKDCYPLLPAELRANPAVFVPAEIRAKSEVIDDLGADNAKYTKVWDQVKAAE